MANRPKRNVAGLVIFQDPFLNDRDKTADASLPLIPPVDLYETPECYVLSAELPGVEADDVHVEVRGSELSIWGERKVDTCCSEESYHRLEGIRGRFHRSFRLPESVKSDARIAATLKDGILNVEVAKSSESRNINIRPPGAKR